MKNKKKVTLLGVAFIAAVITLAGVGYAVSNTYTATTVSQNNQVADIDVDYIVAKLNSEAYSAPQNVHVWWNEVTTYEDSAYVYTYSWGGADVIEHTLTIVDVDNASTVPDNPDDALKLTVTCGSYSHSGYKLMYRQGEEGNFTEYTGAIILQGNNAPTFGDILFQWTFEPTNGTQQDVVKNDLTGPGVTLQMPVVTYLVEATSAA